MSPRAVQHPASQAREAAPGCPVKGGQLAEPSFLPERGAVAGGAQMRAGVQVTPTASSDGACILQSLSGQQKMLTRHRPGWLSVQWKEGGRVSRCRRQEAGAAAEPRRRLGGGRLACKSRLCKGWGRSVQFWLRVREALSYQLGTGYFPGSTAQTWLGGGCIRAVSLSSVLK